MYCAWRIPAHPLLLAVVMDIDVVFRGKIRDLPSELLYAD